MCRIIYCHFRNCFGWREFALLVDPVVGFEHDMVLSRMYSVADVPVHLLQLLQTYRRKVLLYVVGLLSPKECQNVYIGGTFLEVMTSKFQQN